MIISPLEVFDGPAVTLPATVFLGIVLVRLYNFQVISLGGLVCVYPACPVGPIGPVLNFCSFGVYFVPLGSVLVFNSVSLGVPVLSVFFIP